MRDFTEYLGERELVPPTKAVSTHCHLPGAVSSRPRPAHQPPATRLDEGDPRSRAGRDEGVLALLRQRRNLQHHPRGDGQRARRPQSAPRHGDAGDRSHHRQPGLPDAGARFPAPQRQQSAESATSPSCSTRPMAEQRRSAPSSAAQPANRQRALPADRYRPGSPRGSTARNRGHAGRCRIARPDRRRWLSRSTPGARRSDPGMRSGSFR